MRASARLAGVACAALLAAGAVTRPLRDRLGPDRESAGTAASPDGVAAIAGSGVSAALLGGLRGVVADGLWLKTYLAWAAGDLPGTERLIRLVTMADDRPVFFWINGARILAYDLTEWRLSAWQRGGDAAGSDRRIAEEQAAAALSYLAEARRHHPRDPSIWVEAGNIHLYRLHDLSAAAECYRKAALLPGAPYYAARIHGELLRRLGREREAYAWLCQLHASLPADQPEAMPQLVLARIRELEKRLCISGRGQYIPASRQNFCRNRQR